MKKILIIEDEILVAKSIESMLLNSDYFVIGIADNAKQVKRILLSDTPDLILCDINLKNEKTGIQIIEEIELKYDFRTIFISALSDNSTLEKISSISDCYYITKPFNEKQLITTIKQAFVSDSNNNRSPSKREINIIRLIAKGFTSREISEQLDLSCHTVETHRKNIINKLNAKTMYEVVHIATTENWI